MSFVHLHVHSQYSFLDGASSLDKLLEKALALGADDYVKKPFRPLELVARVRAKLRRSNQ